MAFQANAFQTTAFQICANKKPSAPTVKYKRVWFPEAKKKFKEYKKAVKVLEQVTAPEDKEELRKIITPYQRGEKFTVEDMERLVQRGQAMRKFERFLEVIRALEEDMLEMLALLLLINEEV